MENYFKKDLIKALILSLAIAIILVALAVWDNRTGFLANLAVKYL